MRTAEIARKTNETEISVSVNLDGTGAHDMATGIGFLDHMLDQLSRHSLIDMTVRCARATCTSISTTPPKMSASPWARRSKSPGRQEGHPPLRQC